MPALHLYRVLSSMLALIKNTNNYNTVIKNYYDYDYFYFIFSASTVNVLKAIDVSIHQQQDARIDPNIDCAV